MAVMLISYDLNAPGQNYDAVIKAIEAYTYIKPLKSGWLIDTTQSVSQVRDGLLRLIDKNDTLLVVRFQAFDWASYVGTNVNEWLNSPLRNWG